MGLSAPRTSTNISIKCFGTAVGVAHAVLLHMLHARNSIYVQWFREAVYFWEHLGRWCHGVTAGLLKSYISECSKSKHASRDNFAFSVVGNHVCNNTYNISTFVDYSLQINTIVACVANMMLTAAK